MSRLTSPRARGRIAATVGPFLAVVIFVACGGDSDDGPPQILSHQNPVAFGNFAPNAETQSFQPILMNDGGGTLTIEAIEVKGDQNCALSPPPALDLELPASLTRTEQAFLNLTYIPGGSHTGEVGTKDQISVAIRSNSAAYPLFEISVCGCVVEDPASAPPCECNLLDVPDGSCGG